MDEPCPSAETLADYGAGRLSPSERSQVERHLAGCEDCFEQFAAAAAFRIEEAEAGAVEEHPRARRRPPQWLSAAAAAAVIAAGLWFVVPKPPGSPGAGAEILALADRLGGADELKAAAMRAWRDDGGGFAFGGSLPTPKRGFRLGVQLLDARVALQAGEGERLEEALDRAAALLPAEGEPREIAERLRTREVGEAESPDRRTDLARLAAAARTIDPAAFDLGAWAEAGRLAALGGRKDLLAAGLAGHLDAASRSTAAGDPAVARELDTIRGALADRQVSDPELAVLERSFEQLILLN